MGRCDECEHVITKEFPPRISFTADIADDVVFCSWACTAMWALDCATEGTVAEPESMTAVLIRKLRDLDLSNYGASGASV